MGVYPGADRVAMLLSRSSVIPLLIFRSCAAGDNVGFYCGDVSSNLVETRICWRFNDVWNADVIV